MSCCASTDFTIPTTMFKDFSRKNGLNKKKMLG